jgi:glycosyltransferase involved in cell wall biosynthesis
MTMPGGEIYISVVVAVRNGCARIGACLDSILAQETPDFAMECLVVDGASTDGTTTVIAGRRFAYGPCELYSWRRGRVVGIYNPRPPELKRTLAGGRFILHSGSFHHRALFANRRRFDPSFGIAGDYAFLLPHLRDHVPCYLDEPVARIGVDGLSMGRSHRANWRSLRESLRAYRSAMDGLPWRLYVRWLYKTGRCLYPR